MESSVYSFNLTLRRIKELIDTTIESIDDYENTVGATVNLTDISDVDEYDLEYDKTLLYYNVESV